MKRKAFTMMELLVVVVIIAILAAMVLGALQMARQAAREAATKATIAKLNNIIMQRYESYLTRRVPIQILPGTQPRAAAQMRLDAIRDLMRMEMPDAKSDIASGPITFSWGSVPEPPLHKLYAANPPTSNLDAAQCLYLVVSMGNPEAMEQFNQSEIGMVDGKPVFVDGWKNPIMWLRWAPGLVDSEIQVADQAKHHDPFDTRSVDGFAFHLIPFIYSSGGAKKSDGTPNYGIDLKAGYVFKGNPYEEMGLGAPIASANVVTINNHLIEQR